VPVVRGEVYFSWGRRSLTGVVKINGFMGKKCGWEWTVLIENA
jgi:hypothetical protein